MHRLYKKERWVIYKADCGFIVQNILMPNFAHTHLESYKMAVRIIDLSIHKRVPNDLTIYLLISLLRVNDDKKYCSRVKRLLAQKSSKDKQSYKNRSEVNVKRCN